MGAIGVGLIAKEQYEKNPKEVSTWDLRDLDTFSYEQQANAPCPFCTNHCQRTIVQFSNGNSWVTNNRCEKARSSEIKNDEVGKQLKETIRKTQSVPDLFQERKKLLFKEYPYPVPKQKEISRSEFQECYPIGIRCHFGQLFSKVWDTKYNYRMKVQERFMKVGCQQ